MAIITDFIDVKHGEIIELPPYADNLILCFKDDVTVTGTTGEYIKVYTISPSNAYYTERTYSGDGTNEQLGVLSHTYAYGGWASSSANYTAADPKFAKWSIVNYGTDSTFTTPDPDANGYVRIYFKRSK